MNLFSQSLGYQFEKTNISVQQAFLALVDTAMTAGRGKRKLSAAEAASSIIRGMEQDKMENNIGLIKLLRTLLRLSPSLAKLMLKRRLINYFNRCHSTMKALIKLFLIIATVFASTFIIVKLMGLLTVDQIEGWLIQAKSASVIYVGSIVAVLLFADLFIAIPTLTVTILSGYFLGHTYGAISALAGTMLAGISGYAISYYYGNGIMSFLIKDEKKAVVKRLMLSIRADSS